MKKYLVFLFIIFFSGFSFAQEKLTLKKAISIALQRNSGLIKSKNNLKTNKSQLKNAYGALLPSFGASSGWNWNRVSDKGGGKQIDFFGNVTAIKASQTDTRSYRVSAGGNWVLFNGLANFANISKQKNNLEAARYALNNLKQEIVLQTTEYYYNILNARELLKVRKDNVAYNKKLLETIKEKNKLGSVAIADVYTQQVQLGNAQLAYIQTQNILESAKTTLLNYLALNVLDEYKFEDPYPNSSVNTESYLKEFSDIKTMVNTALKNRLDYKSQLLVYKSMLNGITVAKGGIFPRLTGNYSFSSSSTELNRLFHRKILNVGLNLSIPIFSNFNTENQIEIAKIQAENANEDLLSLKRQIKIEIKQGYLNLVAATKQLDVSIEKVKSASENKKANIAKYNLGSGTILDLLQADRDYTQALNDRINAKYQFYRLRDQLINSLGKLNYKKYE